MRHSAKSHVGLVRAGNEDAYACDAERGLFVIADGMGGLARGEMASRQAADLMLEALAARIDPVLGGPGGRPETLLLDAISIVQAHAVEDNERSGLDDQMGTTLIGLAVTGSRITYAHSGDSRLYAVSPSGQMVQVTRDQTLAQRMIDGGEPVAEMSALYGHILTNHVGMSGTFEPEIASLEIPAGATLLLCTDGLTDMVGDEEIAAIIAAGGNDTEQIAERLVQSALDHGGRDNVTVIVVQYDRKRL